MRKISNIKIRNKILPMEATITPVSVYAESTPNPTTMKFVANKLLIGNGVTVEYTSAAEAKEFPLAAQLFNFPFVTGIFIAGNFISVTKNNLVEWMDVTLELREFIRDYLALNNNKTFIPEAVNPKEKPTTETGENIKILTDDSGEKVFTPIEQRIIELLEEYIRPAVEQDGGAIQFKSYDKGTLRVVLKGSCSGCPSSSFTLKAGIQGLFQKMLPEVTEVVAEEA